MASGAVRRLKGLWRTAGRAGGLEKMCRYLAHGAVKVSCGFYRLPSQLTLLTQQPWNALIILDACRADCFSHLRPDAARVRSMGRFTHEWIGEFARKVYPALGRPPILWFTANAVVDYELPDYAGIEGIRTVPLWESDWQTIGRDYAPEVDWARLAEGAAHGQSSGEPGRITDWQRRGNRGIASVHPARVSRAVRRHIESHGQPERMIVHFLQPHTPYIGRRPLALTLTARNPDDKRRRRYGVPQPGHALLSGQVSWQDVRLAYMANLDLVLPHALELAGNLKGKVILTADHGELLGERGLFGHETSFYSRFVQIVPWLEFDNGPFRPAELTPGRGAPRDRTLMESRLEALGYM